jgi:hypothetical protein
MKKDCVLVTAGAISLLLGCAHASSDWVIDSQEDWKENVATQSNLDLKEGRAVPTEKEAAFQSTVKRFPEKKSVKSLTLSQSPEWLNWTEVANVGPSNLGDSPVALQQGEGNYWMFGRYGSSKKKAGFKSEDVTLEGIDIPLKTTKFKDQYDAPGGLRSDRSGYHAWFSRDMKTWIHHGQISENFSRYVTNAEVVDGQFYFYFDFPNDQDPHLYLDHDLTDGLPGKMMGRVFQDPSDGSDCAVIRDLEGTFHLIAEDWSTIKASDRSWDSPLAIRGISPDGIQPFEIADVRPVDNRTQPTGTFAEYAHPHWHRDDPTNFPGKVTEVADRRNRIKAGQVVAFATYEIHEPEQEAYGDWAAISIGGQYYLFGDYDAHEGGTMSTCWFTSDDINKPFSWCGNIGSGHPDPEILFAEGQFYLLTQTKMDFVSPGPWVESVEVRVGVDTTNDGAIDQWSEWQNVSEKYDYIEGFSKQIAKTAASMDLSALPEGYGFQFEVKMTDTTENKSKPILDKIVLSF